MSSTNGDLRIDTFRPSGSTMTGSVTVKVTHTPTDLFGEGYDDQGRYHVARSRAYKALQAHLDWHYGPL